MPRAWCLQRTGGRELAHRGGRQAVAQVTMRSRVVRCVRRHWLAVAAVLALAGPAAAYLVIPGPVTAARLHCSLSAATRAAAVDAERFRCRRTGADGWQCAVQDPQGSGGGVYRVRVRAHACWTATLVPPGGEDMPATASGCIHLLD